MLATEWFRQRRYSVGFTIGIILGLVAILAIRGQWTGTPLDRAVRSYDRGDWANTIREADQHLIQDKMDPNAIKIKSRALAQLGRHGEARALATALGSERLEVADFLLLGEGLIQQGRLALGSAAIEAASKLDSKNPDTVKALKEAQKKLRSDSKSLARVDRLTAIPDGRTLAELVLGFAAIQSEPANSDGSEIVLDRALLVGRSAFSKLNTPNAVRKLIARLFLEKGRPDEARVWIEKIADRSTDQEANWLLSRTLLAEGLTDEASEALKAAGHFEHSNPLMFEPSRYVGAKACAECHGTIFKSQQSSRHSATMTWGDGLKSFPIPSGEVKDSEDSNVTHRWVRNKANEIEASAQVAGTSYRAIVDYVLGSGHHGFSMLGKDEKGVDCSLRLSYYPPGKSWSMTGGFNPHPTDPHSFLGESLSEENVRSCLNCHSTRFFLEKERKGPEVADKGIGCERCHGPGELHLRSVKTGFPELAIARPKIASPAQRMTLCGQCHAANGGIPPSDPRFIRFQSTTLTYSRCYTESGGRLDCIGCHNPHKDAETSPVFYELRCLSCHQANKTEAIKTEDLRYEPVSAPACPVNPTKACLECHMPKVDKVMPFSTFTDHHIRIRRSEPRPGTSAPSR